MPGPLAGYRIIDVTQMLSGPMATMMLGDQGADVIKVEPPGTGDLDPCIRWKVTWCVTLLFHFKSQ